MATQGYTRPDLLVDTTWLESHIDDPNVRIVDCDVWDTYRRAHISNAVGIWGTHHYIKHPDYERDPVTHPGVMPPEPFTELMARMGIGDDTLVVAYDGFGGLYATRFWWVLNYYGHSKVVVLNGGWYKWADEGRPISTDVFQPSHAAFTSHENPDLLCSVDHGKACVGDASTVFLDVRSEEEWLGTNDRGNRRAGHVPGAVHLEWLDFVTGDKHRTFKPAQELRAMLEDRGITTDKQVITY